MFVGVFQENVLLDAMYETPGSDVAEITVNSMAVNKQQPLLYIHRNTDESCAKNEQELALIETKQTPKRADSGELCKNGETTKLVETTE